MKHAYFHTTHFPVTERERRLLGFVEQPGAEPDVQMDTQKYDKERDYNAEEKKLVEDFFTKGRPMVEELKQNMDQLTDDQKLRFNDLKQQYNTEVLDALNANDVSSEKNKEQYDAIVAKANEVIAGLEALVSERSSVTRTPDRKAPGTFENIGRTFDTAKDTGQEYVINFGKELANEYYEKPKEFVINTAKKAGDIMTGAMQQMNEWQEQGETFVGTKLLEAARSAKSMIDDARSSIGTMKDVAVKECVEFDRKYLAPLDKIAELSKNVATGMVDGSRSFQEVGADFDALLTEVDDYAAPVIDSVASAIESGVSSIGDGARAAGQFVQERYDADVKNVQRATAFAETKMNDGKRAVGETWTGAGILVQEGTDNLRTAVADAKKAVDDSIAQGKNVVDETVKGSILIAQEKIQAAANQIEQAKAAAVNELASVRDTLVNKAVDMDKTYLAPVERIAGKLQDISSSLVDGKKTWEQVGQQADAIKKEALDYAAVLGKTVNSAARGAKESVGNRVDYAVTFGEELKKAYVPNRLMTWWKGA